MLDPTLGSLLLGQIVATGVHYQTPFVLLVWLILLRRRPADRQGLNGSLALYLLALVALLAAVVLTSMGLAAARPVREFALLLLGLALIRLSGLLLFRVLLPAARLVPPGILEDLAVFAGYVVWAMVRMSQVGVDLGSIVTTSAVITAILAFALQDTLGNILGGTTLQLENSIHLGDWIKVGDTTGRVVDIRWRSTVIETRNWETIVIPNSVLMKAQFSILGRRQGEPLQWRRWVWFNVDFSVAPQRVVQTVEDALRRARIPNVAATPAPNCVVMDIGDSTVRYAARYWLTDLAADDPTDSEVREHVYAAFRRTGIHFAFPTQFLHVQKEGEKHAARVHRKDLEQRMAVLKRIALFSSFSEPECRKVAEHLIDAPFLAGETITRQGDVAHWLYLIASGEVEVMFDTTDGQRRSLGKIQGGGPGGFFGEMGMLTGEPRTASVVALTDVECYRLDKDGFEQILRARPGIAEDVSTVMSQRRADLVATQQELSEEARKRLVDASHSDLLGRIRHFFGMQMH